MLEKDRQGLYGSALVCKCCFALQNANVLLSSSAVVASGAVFALMDHPSVCQEMVRDLLMDLPLLSNPIILLCMNKELRNQCLLLLFRHTSSPAWGRQWITPADEQHRKLRRSLPSTLPTDIVVTWKEMMYDVHVLWWAQSVFLFFIFVICFSFYFVGPLRVH